MFSYKTYFWGKTEISENYAQTEEFGKLGELNKQNVRCFLGMFLCSIHFETKNSKRFAENSKLI